MKQSLKSSMIAKLGNENQEQYFFMYDFERFSDDSSVHFLLQCKSSNIEVRNFDFYADYNSFRNFYPDLLKMYNVISGTVVLKQTWESSIIEVDMSKHGQIRLENRSYILGEYSQKASMELKLDQSYLPEFLASLKNAYIDLKLLQSR